MTTSTPGLGCRVDGSWRDRHRQAWEAKRLLRSYYQQEFFDRIIAAMPPGPSLELGAGAGLFAEYYRCDVVSDVTPAPYLDRAIDAQSMPFADESFASVVAIDVLHHVRAPARALAEIGRVLRPGGRLILIEPWTGPFGILVNKYLHDEDCSHIEDPWGEVFGGDKDPMDGNAMIPKALFVDHAADLPERTGLSVIEVTPFSCTGFLSTGGFTRWRLPAPLGRMLIRIERRIPTAVWRIIGLKVLIVAERAPARSRQSGRDA